MDDHHMQDTDPILDGEHGPRSEAPSLDSLLRVIATLRPGAFGSVGIGVDWQMVVLYGRKLSPKEKESIAGASRFIR
jgi:hypothetical protein